VGLVGLFHGVYSVERYAGRHNWGFTFRCQESKSGGGRPSRKENSFSKPVHLPVITIMKKRVITPPIQPAPHKGRARLPPSRNPKPRTSKLTAQQAGSVPIRVMSEAGPLRIFSETPFRNNTSYESPSRRGFAGSYVCVSGLVECDGLYRAADRWLCPACRSTRAPALRWLEHV
jgi:hypothetical protein